MEFEEKSTEVYTNDAYMNIRSKYKAELTNQLNMIKTTLENPQLYFERAQIKKAFFEIFSSFEVEVQQEFQGKGAKFDSLGLNPTSKGSEGIMMYKATKKKLDNSDAMKNNPALFGLFKKFKSLFKRLFAFLEGNIRQR